MRRLALLMCRIAVGLGRSMVTFIVLIDCLKMVIGRSNVTGRGQMMVFARRVVLGVRHDAFLPKLSVNNAGAWQHEFVVAPIHPGPVPM
jgi:hypothetical protein